LQIIIHESSNFGSYIILANMRWWTVRSLLPQPNAGSSPSQIIE